MSMIEKLIYDTKDITAKSKKAESEAQAAYEALVADTNDSIANVQGKFAEAAEKAVGFCRANGFNNAAIAELEDYYDRQHYPGLGTVKKISIKNHLLILQDYLSHH